MARHRYKFTGLFQAHISLFQIASHEWKRVWTEIARSYRAANQQRQYLRWTRADGLMYYHTHGGGQGEWLKGGSDERIPEEIREHYNDDPVALLEWYVGGANPVTAEASDGYDVSSILHLEDIHPYIRDREPLAQKAQMIWWLRQSARMETVYDEDDEDLENAILRTVIVGSTEAFHPQELQKELYTVHLGNPTLETLEVVREEVLYHFGLLDDTTKYSTSQAILQAALGLSIMEANLAFSKAIAETGQLTEDEIPIIHAEKKQIINRNGILEFITLEDEEPVIGLDEMQNWFLERYFLFDPEKAKEAGKKPPKGVMLLGIPGCGKSLTAKEAARWWNLPLLRFDIGRAFGSLQGESERNIREALEVAETVSPCILWIDEIEKSIQGSESSGQTDGGTTARVFGHFLTWMQEKKAPVFVLATANNIGAIPPEMLRKGRFDEIFFVDLPNEEARANIFKSNISRRAKAPAKHFKLNNFDVQKLAKLSNGYSGAEIYQAVEDADFDCFDLHGKKIRDVHQNDIIKKIEETVPLSQTRTELEELRQFGKERCRLASSAPQEKIKKRKKVKRTKAEMKKNFEPEFQDENL